MFQESCAQPEVTILHLGEGTYFLQENSSYISFEEKPRPNLSVNSCFLTLSSSFIFTFPPFLDKQLFEYVLLGSGRVKEAE